MRSDRTHNGVRTRPKPSEPARKRRRAAPLTVETLEQRLVLSGTAQIQGVVGHDVNGDGTLGQGEPGLEGFTVFIDRNNNGKRDPGEQGTRSGENGVYRLKNLAAGSYLWRIKLQDDWRITTPPGDGGNSGSVEDGGVLSGPSQNFGLNRSVGIRPRTISGRVVHDQQDDGQLGNDPGLFRWRVYLDGNNNGEHDRGERSTLSDENGAYELKNIDQGFYIWRVVPQRGWESTTPSGDGGQSGTVPPGGGPLTGQDFGFRRSGGEEQRGQARGMVFHDLNSNGKRDTGEPGIAGETIFVDVVGGGQRAETTTNRNGRFTVSQLTPATYVVTQPSIADGLILTRPASGRFKFDLAPGEVKRGLNFGNAPDEPAPPETFVLEATKSGKGAGLVRTKQDKTIHCGKTCSASYEAGEKVTLRAIPRDGSVFVEWKGACSGTGTCSVTMNSDKQAEAIFDKVTLVDLNLKKTGPGKGRIQSVPISDELVCGRTCSKRYPKGTEITLKASPFQGSLFAGWEGGPCTGTGNCVVTLDKSLEVTARFKTKAEPAIVDAALTNGRGEVTIKIGQRELAVQISDETTGVPLRRMAVSFALDPDTKAFGVLSVMDPREKKPPRFAVIHGSEPAARTRLSTAAAQSRANSQDEQFVPLNFSKLGEEIVQGVATHQLPQFKGKIEDAFKLKSLAFLSAKAAVKIANVDVDLGPDRTETLTPKQAMNRLAKGLASNAITDVALFGVTGGVSGFGIVSDLLNFAIDATTVMNCGASGGPGTPRISVSTIPIIGLSFYECEVGPARDPNLVSVHVPTAEELTTGSLELFRKTNLGEAYRAEPGKNGFSIDVPSGDYIMNVRSEGYRPKTLEVRVPRGGLTKPISLKKFSKPTDPPPPPPPPPPPTVSNTYVAQVSGSTEDKLAGIACLYHFKLTGKLTMKLSGKGTAKDPFTGKMIGNGSVAGTRKSNSATCNELPKSETRKLTGSAPLSGTSGNLTATLTTADGRLRFSNGRLDGDKIRGDLTVTSHLFPNAPIKLKVALTRA